MDAQALNIIYGGKASLEDLYVLHKLGFEFVISNGIITEILY